MATVNLTIESGAEDGFLATFDGSHTLANQNINVNNNSVGLWLFTNVQIPQGADISGADLSVTPYVHESQNDLLAGFQALTDTSIDDLSTVGTTATLTTAIASRTFTRAEADAHVPVVVSLVDVVQEIVNQVGWTPGSNIAIWATKTGGTSLGLSIAAFEHPSYASATLDIEFNSAPEITVGPTVDTHDFSRIGPKNTFATVTLTATDIESVAAQALTYEIRTGANGTGNVVASGTCTSGFSVDAVINYNAAGMSEGPNELFVSVTDGTLRSADSPITIHVDLTPPSITNFLLTMES